MAIDPRITPKQQAQERALRFALLADTAVLALMVPVGILGGSLTLKAEAIRFVLMLLIEYFAYASCGASIEVRSSIWSSAAASSSRSPIS